jgi:DNA adenine methylase
MRHIKTCLRYPGGKFYGFKVLEPFLNVPHDEFREVFVGGASVFLGKKSAKVNWINDIDKELIAFYNVIAKNDKKKKLYKLLEKEKANRKRHAEILKMNPKNNVEIAFKYFYLNRTSFSGIMNKPRWGYALGSSVTPNRWTKLIDPVSEKVKNIKITSLDFKKVIKKNSNNSVLLYLDPPYYRASKSIYKNEFTLRDHRDLCKLLKTTKFKFILSYENSTEIREMYKWANIYETNFTYFMSEARRQNGNELIITNFKLN